MGSPGLPHQVVIHRSFVKGYPQARAQGQLCTAEADEGVIGHERVLVIDGSDEVRGHGAAELRKSYQQVGQVSYAHTNANIDQLLTVAAALKSTLSSPSSIDLAGASTMGGAAIPASGEEHS